MKQETTIFNADYCFSYVKGRRVLEKQASCGLERQGASMHYCARVGEWNFGMIFDVCGFN